MKILYLIISVVLLNCSCSLNKNITVDGIVLNNNETIPSADLPQVPLLKLLSDDSPTEINEILLQPRILTVEKSVDENASDPSSPLAVLLKHPIRLNENSLNQPKILPVLTSGRVNDNSGKSTFSSLV